MRHTAAHHEASSPGRPCNAQNVRQGVEPILFHCRRLPTRARQGVIARRVRVGRAPGSQQEDRSPIGLLARAALGMPAAARQSASAGRARLLRQRRTEGEATHKGRGGGEVVEEMSGQRSAWAGQCEARGQARPGWAGRLVSGLLRPAASFWKQSALRSANSCAPAGGARAGVACS